MTTATTTRETVREAMTTSPATATITDSLEHVANLMVQHDCGAIPVVNDGKVVGMITDRDIVVRTIAKKEDPYTRTVGDVMSPGIEVVRDDDSLDKAFTLMSSKKVRRLPVVDRDNRIVGMIAQADLALDSGQDRTFAHTVERISEPTRPN